MRVVLNVDREELKMRICTPVDVLFAEHLLSSDAKLLFSKVVLT